MSRISIDFTAPPDFVYDPTRPTYYTELLSWATHKHQAALSAAGAAVDIETSTHAEQVAALSAYGADLETWSGTAVNLLSAFLTGADDLESPVIPDFPGLPDLLVNAVNLLPGGKIALMLKGLVPFVRGWFALQDKLRPTDPVRILDKALLKDSWFLPGYRKSWLEEIREGVDAIAEKESSVSVLLPYLQTTVGSVKLADLLDNLVARLTTQDCSANPLSIADLLSMALGDCVDIGNNMQGYQSIKNAVENLAAAIAGASVQIETEKAARVSIAGIDAQEDMQFP